MRAQLCAQIVMGSTGMMRAQTRASTEAQPGMRLCWSARCILAEVALWDEGLGVGPHALVVVHSVDGADQLLAPAHFVPCTMR